MKSVKASFFGALLACLFFGTSAFGAYGARATVAEAHAALAATFAHYRIGYVVWHGPGLYDNHKGHAAYYGGADCVSELGPDRTSRAFAVDWSRVSGIDYSGAEALYVMGQLMRAAQYADRDFANFHLYFPDARIARRVSNAFNLLHRACERRTPFD